MKKKKLLLLLISTVILVILFSNLLFAQAQTITIDGIKAHDIFNYGHEPSNFEEVDYTLNNRPSGRTGYSGILYRCVGGQWIQDGPEVNTDDSGRDKKYSFEEYEKEIKQALEAQYGEERVEELYQAALNSGASLVYDESRGKKVIYSSGNSGTKLPCKDGDNGYFYNNLDFWLKLEFELPDKPDKCEPSLRVTPPSQTIYVGEIAQYRAIYTDEHCVEHDVTDEAEWSVSDPSVAVPVVPGK